jgi:hypothetical protein
MLKLHFDYFTNEEKFSHIKRKFLFQDESFQHSEAHISHVSLDIDDIVCIRKTNADVNEADETSVLNLNFYKDHIPPSVIRISEQYKKEFIEAYDGDYSLLEIGEGLNN